MHLSRPSLRTTLCAVLTLAVACFLLVSGTAVAAVERYDYDAIGRLVRVIDEAGRVTTYTYDAAGNILKVATGESAASLVPAISDVSPSSIRRGESKNVKISGQNLAIGELSSPTSGLSVSGVTLGTNEVNFTLTAGATTPLGTGKLVFFSAAGSAQANLTVNALLPAIAIEPTPLALPPDSVPRQIRLTLSHADNIDHTVKLASSNANVFSLGTTQLTIAAGQTSANVMVTGKAAGSAVLTATSSTLATAAVPVYVTGEFRGLSTSFARPLGVVFQERQTPPTAIGSNVTARPLGVAWGAFLATASPSSVMVGEQVNITVTGAGIPADAAISLHPTGALTLGAPTIAVDGKSLSFTVAVAADAAPIPRAIRVVATGGPLAWANPQAGMLHITSPLPELISVEPFFATAGQTLTLRLRGKNLHGASAITFSPAAGLIPEAPQVNAAGTELTARVQIFAEAQTGPRLVTVHTLAGTSNATAGPVNTFHIVNEIGSAYTPIASRVLGVVVEAAEPPTPALSTATHSRSLGVIVGAAVQQASPKVAIIGRTDSLVVRGVGLDGVTAVKLFPPTGVALGTPTVSADGKTVSLSINVAADAPQNLRALQVFAGADPVSFLSPADASLRISAPAPVLESVTPNVARTGAITNFVVRGKDLHLAQAVRFGPADDANFGSIQVNSAGTELTASTSISAQAQQGQRALIVTSNGGDSAVTMSPANTVTLAREPGPTITPVTSRPLGIVFAEEVQPETVASQAISAAVGVVLRDDTPAAAIPSAIASRSVGVILGAAATGIASSALNRGTSGSLTITGEGLGEVDTVSITPVAGVTLGAPVASANGRELNVPFTVALDAVADTYRITLSGRNGAIEFADPAAATIEVGLGTVILDSITPIFAKQGETLTLTLRGTNMRTATAVMAEPADGIVFESGAPQWSSDAFGDKLVIRFHVLPDAPLGPRVIRAVAPGAVSTASTEPSNTLTVIAP